MDTVGILEELGKRARTDEELRKAFLATRQDTNPMDAFCGLCREMGYELYPMDLVHAGEEFYATMRRSTNGGGENSPMLEGEDDFYELFFASLEQMEG